MEKEKLNKILIKCKEQLNNPLFKKWKDYLFNRGINQELIDYYEIGLGKFYEKLFITIPIKDVCGEILLFKLRKDPFEISDDSKYKNFPVGSQASIFPWEILKDGGEKLCVCEGEWDCILLNSSGMPAITSTAGSGTFKDSWVDVFEDYKDIYTIFDRDKAGFDGSLKLCQKILKRWPSKNVNQIILPSMVDDKKDITDYFVFTNGNLDKLFSAECCHKIFPEFNLEKENFKKTNTFDGKSDITQDDIEKARNANSRDFIKVEKECGGGEAVAFCPFHKESTPSLHLYPGERGWYSYCCGRGGDTISLIMELYKLSFTESVKFILSK